VLELVGDMVGRRKGSGSREYADIVDGDWDEVVVCESI
jgi:hypothetical protein